ncbi:PspC domain-containing protein [Acinetobacter radioresistens]|jgi:phage shock protein PspC (stress-responsive transcriptional regulator)|uniref:PspC domain-containing protein n=1 Tax=Acinetobacter radioresistens TaxID=40216 RepID=UPI000277C8B8|nr:PspC domain-containing protein [Acinetobacter radioresistens]EJO34144.1 PspC domain protein [Acinetobacter radioresistens WC-A-157]QCS13268.1 PspC domain-containing protein [Acinetobacter radioresistens]
MSDSGLYRSNRQNMIAGVMGGIAERFGWNANLLRIIFVLISIMSAAFPGILVYLILWLLMPKRDYRLDASPQNYQQPVRTVYDEHKVKR